MLQNWGWKPSTSFTQFLSFLDHQSAQSRKNFFELHANHRYIFLDKCIAAFKTNQEGLWHALQVRIRLLFQCLGFESCLRVSWLTVKMLTKHISSFFMLSWFCRWQTARDVNGRLFSMFHGVALFFFSPSLVTTEKPMSGVWYMSSFVGFCWPTVWICLRTRFKLGAGKLSLRLFGGLGFSSLTSLKPSKYAHLTEAAGQFLFCLTKGSRKTSSTTAANETEQAGNGSWLFYLCQMFEMLHSNCSY